MEKSGGLALFAAMGVVSVVACGQATPPTLGASEFPAPDASPTDAGSNQTKSFAEGGLLPTLCVAGTDAGFCTCVDETPLSAAPNIYFILDRSGSMTELNKWFVVRTVIRQVTEQLGPRINIGVAVFPDPSQDGCAPGVQVMPVKQGDPFGATFGPTAMEMDAVLNIDANGGTPTAATLQNLLPQLQTLAATTPTFVVLATDGGPNCNANITCAIDECQANIESDQGCAPNTPPNCCDPALDGPLSCNDEAATVAAVGAIKAAGVPVYIVGVPGSAPYAEILTEMAEAGGTAQAGSVDGGDGGDGGSTTAYYAVDEAGEDAFESAISQIAAKITASCTLALGSTPDPSMVNVFFDEQPVAPDPVNGWSISGSTITLLGTSCQEVLTGQVLDVRVIAGCPTVEK